MGNPCRNGRGHQAVFWQLVNYRWGSGYQICIYWHMMLRFITLLLFCQSVAAQLPATDSVSVCASNQYREPSLFNIIFIGTNYRKEWATPVCLPVFNPAGLTITELGGGQQTKSLYFKDSNGEEWVLRTVDKDPREAVPSSIRNRFTIQVMQQAISAAHPYAPLTIPTLAKAIGVTAANPVFYWVPDDAALGKYRSLFANTVCLFEKKNIVSHPIKTMESEEMVKKILEGYQVNQEAYLRARLLDMLIGDWDRHPGQWVWAQYKNKIVALPKDRDQAFFRSNGLLAKIVSLVKVKHLVGFSPGAKNIKRLNYKSWNMDRLFTNELKQADWKQIIDSFYSSVTDEVIAEAVNKMPRGIQGQKIKRKLMRRRNHMVKSLPRYYQFLAKQVIIHGTKDGEIFELKGGRDSVTVTIRTKNEAVYKRTFYKKETTSIQLYGLGGRDDFACEGIEQSGIDIRIDDDDKMDASAFEKHLHTYLRIKD